MAPTPIRGAAKMCSGARIPGCGLGPGNSGIACPQRSPSVSAAVPSNGPASVPPPRASSPAPAPGGAEPVMSPRLVVAAAGEPGLSVVAAGGGLVEEGVQRRAAPGNQLGLGVIRSGTGRLPDRHPADRMIRPAERAGPGRPAARFRSAEGGGEARKPAARAGRTRGRWLPDTGRSAPRCAPPSTLMSYRNADSGSAGFAASSRIR